MNAIILVHVVFSLLGIASGFMVLGGLLAGERAKGWTGFFLATTVATNVTAFMIPFTRLLPSHALAALSLVILAVALYSIYGRKLVGPWRLTYVITATLALYVNVFVLVVQLFLRVPALQALAPTQKETPFALTQGIVLVYFLVVGTLAARRAA